MSERWRAAAVALVVGGLLVVVAVVALGRDDDRGAVPEGAASDPAGGGGGCAFGDASSAEAGTAVFRDRVGDAQADHGDLGRVRISHDSGTVTVSTTVAGLRAMDAVVALLDTDCDGEDDYSLRFWRDGSTVLSQLDQGLPLTDLAATTERRGSTYVSRWPLGETARATRFRVRLRVDTEDYASYADEAPDGLPGFWRYGAG